MAAKVLDVRGLRCPMPVVKTKKELATLAAGELLEVVTTDRGSLLDFQGWARTSQEFRLIEQREGTDEEGRGLFIHLLERKG